MAWICKNCGGSVVFDAQDESVYCDFCGQRKSVLASNLYGSELFVDSGISESELSLYQRAVRLLKNASESEELKTVAEILEPILHVFNAEELYHQCMEKYRVLSETENYNMACTLAESEDPSSLTRAMELFSENPQWERSRQLYALCKKKRQRINAEERKRQKRQERRERARKRRKRLMALLFWAAIGVAVWFFATEDDRKYNVEDIDISLCSIDSEYRRNVSGYINGRYYINFEHEIENNTAAVIDHLEIVTQIKDSNGKLINQFSTTFGGYGGSALDLQPGESVIIKTHLDEKSLEENDSFTRVYGSDVSDWDISITINGVTFGDGHRYNK